MNMQPLKALSDGTRLKIVEFVRKHNNRSCCDIARYIERDKSTTCRQIEILRKAGILGTKKKGKFVVCKVKKPERIGKLFRLLENF